MSNFQDWQKQRDEEVDAPGTGLVIGVMMAFVIVFVVVIFFGLLFGEDKGNACEELGGTFTVVDTEYSAALKRTIDVYGCVK